MFLSSHLHQLFKLNHDPAKRPKARGGGSLLLRDPKRGTSLGLGGGVTFFKRSKKEGGSQEKSCKPK